MECKTRNCKKDSVISGYCKDHFLEYFEKKVFDTIKKYRLLNKDDKVAVAVSGGKDSLSTLYLLKKFGYNAEGLAIDEGIKGYRETTIKDLKNFSKKNKIKIQIIDFKKEFKTTLDSAVKKTSENPCHTCGVLRRFLLNKYSKGYDVIATGHNLDDEAQAIMMNILKAQTELQARLGPVTGLKQSSGFTKRIKPLYLIKEKEVKAYTILKGFEVHFTECPYAHRSFRGEVQNMLNILEEKKSGSKENLVKSFLRELPDIQEKFRTAGEVNECLVCGEPAAKGVCRTCQLIEKIMN